MIKQLLRRFVDANVKLCDSIERGLPSSFKRSLLVHHETTCAEKINGITSPMVVDVGGGHLCPYAGRLDPTNDAKIIAVDILFDQLRANSATSLKVNGDACGLLPIRDMSLDVLTSRSVMEHLPDNDTFVRETHRSLKPGGYAIHVFPCKWAPFSVINRLLPNRVSKILLDAFFPRWKAECGFKVFYDHCDVNSMTKLFTEKGFEIESATLRYYQSIYFKMFILFYLISLTYDLVIWKLNVKKLACQVVLVARKAP